METTFLEALKNSPSAIACIVLVGMFLRHLKDLRIKEEAEAKERRDFVEKLSTDCHAHSKEMHDTTIKATDEAIKVIRECGQSIATNTEVLRRVEQNQHERQ